MTDILVIGGRNAWLSVAAQLTTGATVTLLEAESALGYHTSGRPAALIGQNDGAPSVRAVNRASVDRLRQDDRGYLSPRCLMILSGAEQHDARTSALCTVGLDETAPSEARAMVPVLDPAKVAYAQYDADAHNIETDCPMQDFARELRQNGDQIASAVDVNKIIMRSATDWQVETASETYAPQHSVNAAGARPDHLAELAGAVSLDIVSHPRSIAYISVPARHGIAAWPMFFGVGESWYAHQDAGTFVVFSADEDRDAPHYAWAEDLTLARRLAPYEDMETALVLPLLARRAGLHSIAPERRLVSGQDANQPSFFWCGGQAGNGVQTAPVAARSPADPNTGGRLEIEQMPVAALAEDRLQ